MQGGMRKASSLLVVVLLVVVATLGYNFYICKMDAEAGGFSLGDADFIAKDRASIFTKKRRKLPEIDDSFLAKLRRQGQVQLPLKAELPDMSTPVLLDTLHSYLGNIDIICQRILRMGNLFDGGWEVCDDEDYRPIKPCLVYSFGIQGDFSFDDYTASNYGCEVVAFDPSMDKESHQRSPLVRFVKQGVAERDITPVSATDWELHTVTSFKKIFGHSEKGLDILKMDIEGSEWAVLAEFIQSGEASRTRQLLVEFHLWNKERGNYLKALSVLKDLHDLGFRKFYSHKNPGCFFEKNDRIPVQRTDCYEVHYVNTNMIS